MLQEEVAACVFGLSTIFGYSIVLVLPCPITQAENLRTIIVIADIHQGLHSSPPSTLSSIYFNQTQSARQRPWLTFWHWSSVTPYTSSYEFAGSCVFGKQLPGRLSLRPILLWAGLIPKVRPLICRVPWSTLTRSPYSTRADHLCRFAVRSYVWLSLEVFLGRLFINISLDESSDAPLS